MKTVYLICVFHGMYAPRKKIDGSLYGTHAVFSVTYIIGPRQVGKTTLAKQIATKDNSLYLDLERQAASEKLKEDPAFPSRNSRTST